MKISKLTLEKLCCFHIHMQLHRCRVIGHIFYCVRMVRKAQTRRRGAWRAQALHKPAVMTNRRPPREQNCSTRHSTGSRPDSILAQATALREERHRPLAARSPSRRFERHDPLSSRYRPVPPHRRRNRLTRNILCKIRSQFCRDRTRHGRRRSHTRLAG